MKVTLADVAKRANVSTCTVSRVLNNKHRNKVGEETRHAPSRRGGTAVPSEHHCPGAEKAAECLHPGLLLSGSRIIHR